MTPDELKAMPKGQFIVMKTGAYPMKTGLRLFFDWGIRFGQDYMAPENGNRAVAYAEKRELIAAIARVYHTDRTSEKLQQPKTIGAGERGRTPLRPSPREDKAVNRDE